MDIERWLKICSNCEKRGHLRKDCWAKGGGEEGQGPSFKQVIAKNHDETSQGKTWTEAHVHQLIEGIMRTAVLLPDAMPPAGTRGLYFVSREITMLFQNAGQNYQRQL